MKEKDLKIKAKKDTLKVLDRKVKPARHKDTMLNTRLKAEFIRSKAEGRKREPEDGMSRAANDAAEQYETAAASIGSYGAGRLKEAFRQEKRKERLEQPRQREKQDEAAEPDKAENLKYKQNSRETAYSDNYNTYRKTYPTPDNADVPQGRGAVKEPWKEQKAYQAEKRKVFEPPPITQGTPMYPQSRPVYPESSIFKRRFWEKHRKKQIPYEIPQEVQYQKGYKKHSRQPPSLARSHQAETIKYSTAANSGGYSVLPDKKYIFSKYSWKRAAGKQTRKEEYPAEKKKSVFVQKLKIRLLPETGTPHTAKNGSFKKRLRQSGERAAAALAKDILVALSSLAGIVALFVIIGAIAALVSTAFGIFFSPFDAGDGVKTISGIVAETNQEFYAKASGFENASEYDSVEYHSGGGNTLFITNWPEVVAVFAAKISGDADNALDAVTMDAERERLLKKVFWDMNDLSGKAETITDKNGEEKTVLHITHTSKSSAEMADFYHFTPYQRQALEELLKPEYAQMLSELVGTLGISGGGSITLTPEQVKDMLANLPENLPPERKAVMQAAYSLVGKVNYFWGGKSAVIGWDSRWGTPTKVTSAGSNMTGTTRPFGLDCSGFVTWAFINATGDPSHANVIGHGAANQYGRCKKISWSEAQPGDLVFYPDLGHVGIIAGTDANGNLLVVHCASSQNNVVVTGLQGFTKIGRPVLFE